MWVQVPPFTLIFWENISRSFINNYSKNLIENGFDNDVKKNFNGRGFLYYLLEEDEILDNVYFTDWFEFVKNARKVQAEKEYFFIKNPNIVKFNLNILINLKSSLIDFKKSLFNLKDKKIFKQLSFIFSSKNKKIFELYNYYMKLNFNKIRKIKEKNYFKSSGYLILILDIRFLKPKIVVINNNKTMFSLTIGSIYKKLGLNKKKLKKTEKMLNLLLRTAALSIKKKVSIKNYILHLKGTRANIFNILVLINRNFKDKKLSIIYAPHIPFGRFKFKKIKSIKKRLRKKFTKLIKN